MDPEGQLDPSRRDRIRQKALAALPSGPRPSDRVYAAVALAGAPLPYLIRAFVAAVLGLGLLAGTTVASADSLPEEPLYGLKLASEQVRLALAQTPADRASVELSLAESRLTEAERLAAAGRESAAIIATSAYGSHLASAAAELATIEADPGSAALVEQLQERIHVQEKRVAKTVEKLLESPATALAGVVLNALATATGDPGESGAARMATKAAAVSANLAELAVNRAAGNHPLRSALPALLQQVVPSVQPVPTEQAAPSTTPVPSMRSVVTTAAPANSAPVPASAPRAELIVSRAQETPSSGPTASPSPSPTLRPSATPERAQRTEKPTPSIDPSAGVAAKKAQQAAEKAQQAAERAREAAERAKEKADRAPAKREPPRRR